MIQAVDRALRVLELLSEQEGKGMSIRELAEALDVDKSTISRLVATLRYHDTVQINRTTGKYQLGLRILHFNSELEKTLDIIDIARPIIRETSEKLKQSVHLCAFNNTLAYIIDQVVSENTYSLSASIGMIEPMHASSVGKCIMAYRRNDKLMSMLENYDYTVYTENTIRSREKLLEEFEKIRKQGFAVDNEEVSVGVRCVAVPIFGQGNYVRYSLGISGPIDMMTESNMELYIEKLHSTAKKIGKELGGK